MAEVSNDISKPIEDQDEEKTKVDMDGDSGDGYDYSSGSDRSLEADDADIARCDADSAKSRGDSTMSLAERRKSRHGSHGSRRHKGGSRHKNRGFHPYMDPQEEMHLKRKSQELQEKENATAVVRQEGESHFMNFPIAPFNSTQYLMDEHDSGSPAGMHRTTSSSKLGDDSQLLHSLASTPAETQHEVVSYERKDKEFTDIYATVHAESLQSLPKDELVKNYMSLEEKVAALQKKVAEAEQLMRQNDDSGESQKQTEATDSISSSSVPCSDEMDTNTDSMSCSGDLAERSSQEVSRPTISVGDVDVSPVKATRRSSSDSARSADVASR